MRLDVVRSVWQVASKTPAYQQGLEWYKQAHSLACTFRSPKAGAAVIAVLSPLMPWDENVKLAIRVRDGYAPATFGRSRQAAYDLMGGADPLTVLRGPKVRSFYWGILTEGRTVQVCVDRHMWRLVNWGKRVGKAVPSESAYLQAQTLIQAASLDTGLWPAQMQAILWCWIRQGDDPRQMYLFN